MNEFITEDEINSSFVNECKFKMDSYLSKDELIEMLNKINFIAIKTADLELITGYIADGKRENLQVLTKNIRID